MRLRVKMELISQAFVSACFVACPNEGQSQPLPVPQAVTTKANRINAAKSILVCKFIGTKIKRDLKQKINHVHILAGVSYSKNLNFNCRS